MDQRVWAESDIILQIRIDLEQVPERQHALADDYDWACGKYFLLVIICYRQRILVNQAAALKLQQPLRKYIHRAVLLIKVQLGGIIVNKSFTGAIHPKVLPDVAMR